MRQNSRLRKLPKPSIFLLKDRWVCEYYEFDEFSVAKAKRKAFVRDLRREGKQGTPDEQKAAAKAFAAKTLKAQKEQYGFERREKEQKILTPTQLREAKAAFAIFDQIPNRKKSLVDAVVLYREHLKLAIDTPSLEHAVLSFIGRKKTAGKAPGDHGGLKGNSIKTLKRHLMHMLRYFQKERPAIKLGDIGSMDLKRYFSTITSSERNCQGALTHP